MGSIREFLRWWLGQLAEMVPAGWRRVSAEKRTSLILAPDFPAATAASVRLEKRGHSSFLGRFSFDANGLQALKRAIAAVGRSADILVELPGDALLEKHLSLPLAAERELDRVIAYEMDRETPFAVDEVYWDSEIEARDRTHRKLAVRLSMVAKEELAELAMSLASAGLAPRALIAKAADGTTRYIPFHREAVRRSGWRAYALPVAAGACIVLGLFAVGLPFVRQYMALAQVDRELAELQPSVDIATQLRARIDASRRDNDSLAAERKLFGDPLAMLSAITAALPDDTRLTELNLTQRKLVITGQSKAAARLIGDITKNSAIKDPAFSAPVTRVEAGKYDVFTISAEMTP